MDEDKKAKRRDFIRRLFVALAVVSAVAIATQFSALTLSVVGITLLALILGTLFVCAARVTGFLLTILWRLVDSSKKK